MLKIGFVEDDPKMSEILTKYINQYMKAKNRDILLQSFSDAESLLSQERTGYDVLFLDIELPGIDGLTLAKKVRECDKSVIIVFVTNMSQLAIRGYEVDALDFILKPILYSDFSFKLDRIMRALPEKKAEIIITTSKGMKKVSIDDILYVEVIKHTMIYHLLNERIDTHTSLSSVEDSLLDAGLLKCNRCYLVNPEYISSIEGYELKIGNDTLMISHPQRKSFMNQLNAYIAKGGVMKV